jgi:sulfite exporter TauE/SafE
MILALITGVVLGIVRTSWGVAIVALALVSLLSATADVFLPGTPFSGRAYNRYLERMKTAVYQPLRPWVGYVLQGTMWGTILGAIAFQLTRWVVLR